MKSFFYYAMISDKYDKDENEKLFKKYQQKKYTNLPSIKFL